ncbi:MAG: MarR family transcriptional regulator, partial [Clostridium sp.]|nr:MarR family transcriptional regulator [Clostridium sp.]
AVNMDEKMRLSLLLKIVNNLFERELNSKISTLDLTRAQCSVLSYLNKNKDKEINPGDIERTFNLKRPTVTGILQRLEEKNFIIIEQRKNDKRYKQVKLTDKSKEIDYIMKKNLFEAEKILYKNISDKEKDELYRILKIMMDNLVT